MLSLPQDPAMLGLVVTTRPMPRLVGARGGLPPQSWQKHVACLCFCLDVVLYGHWEALDMLKSMPQDVRTFSATTIGKLIPRTLIFVIF